MQAEGLEHQVIGPAHQAADSRVHLLAGGKHQHRKVRIHPANLLKHLLSILDRHIQIKYGQAGISWRNASTAAAPSYVKWTWCPSASKPRLRNNPSALSSSAINNLMATFLFERRP